jgi:heme-degrading monooxygenase HmoA
MTVKLLNAFIVPEDQEEAFLKNWTETATFFSQDPGFVETHLHKNTGVGNPTFRFINIATWTSAEAWRSTHTAYRPKEYDLPGVKGHAAIFEPIVDMYPNAHSKKTA